jgi:large conductance mechanosensitive channel
MLKEFKEFALRGNMIDLAIGIVIGAAFSTVITSLVDDIIMPPIALLQGGVNFQDKFLVLSGDVYPTLAEAQAAGSVTLNYGIFLTNIVYFILVAFAIFLVVKAINRMYQPETEPDTDPTFNCPHCLAALPIGATRCQACTSELDTPENQNA